MKFNKEEYLKDLAYLIKKNAIPDNKEGLKKNIDFIMDRLKKLDFTVTQIGDNADEPILYAVRKAKNSNGKIGLYAHYDVELTNKDKWLTNPVELEQVEDRLFGRGIADNLGIWLLRMYAIEELKDENLPEIHWLFQGQEEIGSLLAHKEFPKMKLPEMDVWFEETGYFDLGSSRQRFLTLNEDEKLSKAKEIATEELQEIGFTSYTENRGLTKFDKCPFLTHILNEQPYFAIGPNDEYSKIHQPNESLSLPLIELSFKQFKEIIRYYAE